MGNSIAVRARCRSLTAVTVTGALAALGLAGAATAYTGSPAARRLAERELKAWRHVANAKVTSGGDIYLCEKGPNFVLYTGPRAGIPAPTRSCFHHATQTVYVAMVHGKVLRRLEIDHAGGMPDQAIYEDASGQYFGQAGAHCWTKATRSARSGLGPFFGFARNERLSIAPSRRGMPALQGVVRQKRASETEIDLLNPSSGRTVYEIDTITGPKHASAQITRKYSPTASFPIAQPTPLCGA